MDPKVIVVANTKGGVGKTTVALQIAIGQALVGKDVWYVDGDRQQTGLGALTLRESQKVKTKLSCAAFPNAMLLGKQVQLQADKYDLVVIDVGGYDSAAMRTALVVADLLIMPFQPRSFDTWAISPMTALLEEVSVQRKEKIPAYAILNCADPANSSDNREAVQTLEGNEYIEYLDTPLCRRKAYATASGFGMCVAELQTKDPKAIAELNELLVAIFGEDARLGEKKKVTRRARK
jgi:chromosome partitioning protein